VGVGPTPPNPQPPIPNPQSPNKCKTILNYNFKKLIN